MYNQHFISYFFLCLRCHLSHAFRSHSFRLREFDCSVLTKENILLCLVARHDCQPCIVLTHTLNSSASECVSGATRQNPYVCVCRKLSTLMGLGGTFVTQTRTNSYVRTSATSSIIGTCTEKSHHYNRTRRMHSGICEHVCVCVCGRDGVKIHHTMPELALLLLLLHRIIDQFARFRGRGGLWVCVCIML